MPACNPGRNYIFQLFSINRDQTPDIVDELLDWLFYL
jgi:hypothetical protein